ncbi:hypothetical protein B5V03_14580 [Bradyrhizobium betae]|uniref:Uncharacterized protein n=1 Tax=Bradyrhizobium betae TaxID=244734 RepID=A0A4Q1VFT9_9BRAD|nr:hypothetical protein B5V03_14580 [Bradyrhizobium betae]
MGQSPRGRSPHPDPLPQAGEGAERRRRPDGPSTPRGLPATHGCPTVPYKEGWHFAELST